MEIVWDTTGTNPIYFEWDTNGYVECEITGTSSTAGDISWRSYGIQLSHRTQENPHQMTGMAKPHILSQPWCLLGHL